MDGADLPKRNRNEFLLRKGCFARCSSRRTHLDYVEAKLCDVLMDLHWGFGVSETFGVDFGRRLSHSSLLSVSVASGPLCQVMPGLASTTRL